MANIVMGLWTAHGPSLNSTPDSWAKLVDKDRSRIHWYKGKQYKFDELVAIRAGEGFDAATECARETQFSRFEACQAAIEKMAEEWQRVKPDVCVIMGNDQHELIHESMMPTFAVYHGETMWHQPLNELQESHLPPGIAEAEWANRPEEFTVYPGQAELANLIIERGLDEGVDFATIDEWPEQKPEHHHVGIPHAFSWLFRRVMKDDVVPTVPVFTNTFWEPNQPRPARCFQMGQLVGRAISDWDSDARVAVIGSGGMSHFAVDEALDRSLMDAMQQRDADTLKSVDPALMKSGTSEWLNWIAACGAVFDTELKGDIIDYQLCYRSEAGTGAANGFVVWS